MVGLNEMCDCMVDKHLKMGFVCLVGHTKNVHLIGGPTRKCAFD